MALSESEIELCAKWVSAPNHKWQTLNRAQWKYIFREKTLVRYVDVAKMDEDIVPLLLEYLTAEDGSGGYLCSSTLQLYGQNVAATWTPVRAWYEITNKAAGSVAGVRLYHALTSEPEEQEDGPYLVEDGCAYKVSLTYYWKVAELPTVPASTSGVSYRLSFQRDTDNGLYTATIEKRERVQQDIPLYLHAETIYEKHQTEQHLGVKQADVATTGLAAGVANGVLTQRTLSKNSDCTTDVSNAVETEKPVSNAVVERSKRLHAVTRSTTDRNQPTAITDTAGTLKVGETVRSQKTPGGLYDNTHVQVDEEEVGVIGEDCAKTIFEHDHKVHSNVAEKPAPEAAAAGGGHVYGKTARQTEYGTWNVTESDSLEQPVENAVVDRRMTLHGLTESVTNRNQSAPLPAPSKIGHSVVNRKTPGGLYDTVETVEGKTPAGLISEGCTRDGYTHHHSETRNEAEPQEVETEFTPGKIVRKTASLNNNGTANNSTDTATAVPRVNKYSYSRDNGEVVHVVEYKNLPNPYSGYPDGADGLAVHDNLNAYLLHDGRISWVTNAAYRNSIGDLKFIKHGKAVVFYEVAYNRRTRRFKHRTYTVQLHHIRGDAYTDYLSDKMDADISRTTNGIMCVKLISGPYSDRNGNLLAEWEWVSLLSPPGDGGWTYCSSSCRHQLIAHSWEQIQDQARKLMGIEKGEAMEQGIQQIVSAIRELPDRTAAAQSHQTLEMWRSQNQGILDDQRRGK